MILLLLLGTKSTVLISVLITLLIILLAMSLNKDGRQYLQKYYHLTNNYIGVEIGYRGVVKMLVYISLIAGGAAYTKGLDHGKIDWGTFGNVFFVISIFTLLANLLPQSSRFRDMLSPTTGRIWREARKDMTAGLLKRISLKLTEPDVPISEVQFLLRELLDIIVLHVRDHRGSHTHGRHDVFANLLLVSERRLVVVARDVWLHSAQYERPIPAWYDKATMICGYAIDNKKPASSGCITRDFPRGPQNKPYQSVLAIPLFGSSGDEPYGVVSLDCSRPYFFDSFHPGKVESGLENSLQPYLQLITMILEVFVSRDFEIVVEKLARPTNAASAKEVAS